MATAVTLGGTMRCPPAGGQSTQGRTGRQLRPPHLLCKLIPLPLWERPGEGARSVVKVKAQPISPSPAYPVPADQ
jgi:hypothetical protein